MGFFTVGSSNAVLAVIEHLQAARWGIVLVGADCGCGGNFLAAADIFPRIENKLFRARFLVLSRLPGIHQHFRENEAVYSSSSRSNPAA